MSDLVLIDLTTPRIGLITLNRAEKRNALSLEFIAAITDAVVEVSKEPQRRVMVIRAAGPTFCAGLDLVEAADADLADQSAHALAGLYLALCHSSLVTIAAAQGAALGGGAGLATACDLVVAADNFQLGYPEVHRGLVGALVSCILRRQVGDRTTREILLLGQTIDAQRSLALGLVNRVVPASELEMESRRLAQEATKGAPGAIARTKRLLDDLAPRPIADDFKVALRYHVESRNSAEAAEGMAAFREKRRANWL